MPLNITQISPEVQQAKQRFGIVGNAPALIEAVNRATQVAPIDLSVLITGESGTGKEFFPQIIHAFSPRKHSKYIAVNCGAIPEGTIDSELFGHVQGAFTGATATRKGYFEEADGGTIFLDEVGELPMTTQARLLRVLESGEYLKVGSSTVAKTNVRIVAATNVDMAKAVAEGKFREDLYYRLSTVQITIPPLRDRGNDISLLARKFAANFAEKYRTPAISLDDSAKRLIERYRWPGNVRQLKNIIEQIALFRAGENISDIIVDEYLPRTASFTPAIIKDQGHSYATEREILFNMIFRMQQEIESLRNEIQTSPTRKTEVSSSELFKNRTIISDHKALVNDFVDYDQAEFTTQEPEIVETSPSTLEDTERETIRRSLERNQGRRKATAQELQISERTLYRKIREYGLE